MSSTRAQDQIDARIQDYYGSEFDEGGRLTSRSAQGPLEMARTLEIIRTHCSGGRIVDIGGGPGILARALIDAGDAVELIDPVERHVMAARAADVSSRIGDARHLPFADDEFDAALVMGPLYHLAERADRLRALQEAVRVTRAGGTVFVSAISRYVAFGAL